MGSTADGATLGLVIAGIWGFLALVYFVWFLWSMSRLFPKIGLPASHGWIPIWNQWQLINRAGYPGWIVLLVLVPGVGGIIVLVFWILTLVRINREFGKGGGYTVLGILIPPLWAMALASHIESGQVSVIRVGAAPYAPPGYHPQPAAPAAGAPAPPAPPAAGQTAPWQPQPSQGGGEPAQGSGLPPVPAASGPQARKDWGFSNTTEDAYEKLAAEQAPQQANQSLTNEVPRPYAWPEATPQAPPPAAPVAPPVAEPLSSPAPASVAPAPADPTPADPTPADPAPQQAAPTTPPVPPQMPPASEDPDIEDDRTIVVPRRTRWGLELPGGEVLELQGDDVTLGRKPTGAGTLLKISDPTRTVSKTHARLRRVDDHWTIEDLHSTNGVALIDRGGEPVPIDPETPTETTERLLIGTLEVTLREL